MSEDTTCRTCKFHVNGFCTVQLPPWLMHQAQYLSKTTFLEDSCDLHKPKAA